MLVRVVTSTPEFPRHLTWFHLALGFYDERLDPIAIKPSFPQFRDTRRSLMFAARHYVNVQIAMASIMIPLGRYVFTTNV